MRVGAVAMATGLWRIAAAVLVGTLTPVTAGAPEPHGEAGIATDWIAAIATMEVEGFARPLGDWTLRLPQDHAAHPEAASELWHLAVHLHDDADRPVGVQLSLFRLALVGPDAPASGAGWGARELHRGHAAIADGATGRAVGEERFGRGMAGLAGFDAETGALRLDDWSLGFGDGAEGWRLEARAGDRAVSLLLTPEAGPLTTEGAAAPFRGYALPWLRAEGQLLSPEGPRDVSGVAWYEHLWGELPLPVGGPVATDRLLLQLDDGTALSLTRARRVDGRGTATVEALVIAPDGTAQALDEARMEPTRIWRAADGTDWPLGWSLELGALRLEVAPVFDDQLQGQEQGFAATLWSGLVRAEGRNGDRPVAGLGTLQLTAYGG